MKNLILFTLLFGFFVLPLSANEEKKEQKEKKYSSATSVSLVLTRGNNKTLSFSFDTEQNLNLDKNKLQFKGSIIYSRLNDGEKSEIHYSHLKYDRRISSRAYLLGLMRVERNVQAGYNWRFHLSGGVGYTLIKKTNIEATFESSLGWSGEKNLERSASADLNQGSTVGQDTFTTSFLSAIFSGKLVYNISSVAQFVQQEIFFLNMSDLGDYRINSNSSITASISRYFALQTSIKIVYEHQPVPGFQNTDFYLLSSIVIKI